MTRINEHHIGYWCTIVGLLYGVDDITAPLKHCIDTGLIPVFTPLPTPIESTETREDMERHAEVVVGASHLDNYTRLFRPCDQGDEGDGFGKPRNARNYGDDHGWMCSPDPYGPMVSKVTEADAVLYVVEGKLPGGAE